MGTTVPMQELITLRGTVPATPHMYKGSVNQPGGKWLNVEQNKDVAFDVHILRMEKDGGTLKLLIQTASSVTGPWKTLKTYDTGGAVTETPYHNVFVASTRAGTGDEHCLQRFARWRVETKDLTTAAAWAICFRMCATMK